LLELKTNSMESSDTKYELRNLSQQASLL
jgi:hypothetical protein